MAIRLRTVDGVRVALCANVFAEKEGDVYLDDADHYALTAKFNKDYYYPNHSTIYAREWTVADGEPRQTIDEFDEERWVLIRSLVRAKDHDPMKNTKIEATTNWEEVRFFLNRTDAVDFSFTKIMDCPYVPDIHGCRIDNGGPIVGFVIELLSRQTNQHEGYLKV